MAITTENNTKKCSKCLNLKAFSDFYLDKSKKDGHSSYCKPCRIEHTKDYASKNQEVITLKRKLHYIQNKEKINQRCKDYYNKYRVKCLEINKAWRIKNRDKIWEKRKDYKKNRKAIDPLFKLKENLRNRLYYALKNKSWHKTSHFNNYIGIDQDGLMKHIESKFQEGMSWDNYGYYTWHIDHIIPLSSAKNEEEMYKLCHYTNLQPLWAEDNLKKNGKLWQLL